MTDSSTEKVKVLSMLEEIQGQLEELESVLESSFSNHRNKLRGNERERLSNTAIRLSVMEHKFAQLNHLSPEEELVYNTSQRIQNLKLAFK
ncbi:hypothetical protein [Neobacillus mesonae]|uniref:hypothetical protein n=1 Tax=Neobacillus mesonae TaxID=1193713 RepID=UPI00203F406A|nr:hypothetical protein [Neobacillus mesonae]MCM3566826.1 hypothetical protein [Neobacillus mesonae]